MPSASFVLLFPRTAILPFIYILYIPLAFSQGMSIKNPVGTGVLPNISSLTLKGIPTVLKSD